MQSNPVSKGILAKISSSTHLTKEKNLTKNTDEYTPDQSTHLTKTTEEKCYKDIICNISHLFQESVSLYFQPLQWMQEKNSKKCTPKK